MAGATLGIEKRRLCGDQKLLDPMSSNPGDIERGGAFVGFANTQPKIEAKTYGQAQRGTPGDGPFDPTTGKGYVEPLEGEYAFALQQGCDVQCLLFETFGGFSAAVRRLIGRAADQVRNKLSRAQHLDEASWSTRTWTTLQCQRISIALHTACAWDIQEELTLALANGAGHAAAA